MKNIPIEEARELLKLKRGRANDSYKRIAERAAHDEGSIRKVYDLAEMIVFGLKPRQRVERKLVVDTLEAARRWNA